MVTGASPQSNVMMPAFATAACSWLKLQLDAVPVPTTVVGFDVSTALPAAGTPAAHEPFGLPAFQGPAAVMSGPVRVSMAWLASSDWASGDPPVSAVSPASPTVMSAVEPHPTRNTATRHHIDRSRISVPACRD